MSQFVDFGAAAADYGRWRQGFPAETFERLAALGVGLPGQALLDLGTGTGLFAREFARKGCRVTGLDPSADLLAQARSAAAAAGTAITSLQGSAEETGLADQAFDVVTAATCWHWFDRAKAAREARRLLKPEGRLVIAHLDWLRIEGNVIDVTLERIDRFAPAQAAGGPVTFQYPAWLFELVEAGFDAWELLGFSTTLTYSREAWRGRVRASARVGPAMEDETLARFDKALAEVLERRWPGESLQVDHRALALVAWSR